MSSEAARPFVAPLGVDPAAPVGVRKPPVGAACGVASNGEVDDLPGTGAVDEALGVARPIRTASTRRSGERRTARIRRGIASGALLVTAPERALPAGIGDRHESPTPVWESPGVASLDACSKVSVRCNASV